MFLGNLGLALNILTIAILSLCFTLVLISIIGNRFHGVLLKFNASSRSKLLWCIVTIPWLISLLSVLVLVFPELFNWEKSWVTSNFHWHHIYSFSIISWHGASLLIFTGLCFFILLSKLVKALRANRNVNQLNAFSNSVELQSGCTLITSESINAFTTGLVNAKAYITSGLNDQLNSQESHVVQLHELAHVTHSDPLKKYVFSLFASFYASKLSDKLNRSYSLALEKLADEAVQKEILDVTLLTKTMIKVARLQLSEKNDFKFRVLQGECSFTENPLESRIYYALNERKGSDFPVLSVFTLVILIAALSTLSVDFLHHSIEQIFAH